MLKEFKTFALRGNVIDLAVGVVIGAAFGKIVSSLVNDIIMPLISLLIADGVHFTNLHIKIGNADIMYGNFIQTIVDFTIITFSIFLVVKLFNKLRKQEPVEEETVPELSKEEQLLTEIRDLLKNK